MEQRTFIRRAQTFHQCSHAASGFKGLKAACPSLAGTSVGKIAVAATTFSAREQVRPRCETAG